MNELFKKNKEIRDLQDGLAQKSEEIEKHEEEKLNELFKKNKEILDLQDGLDKKSVEMQKLNEEIANKIKESLRLEDGLKSEEIQKLQEEITSKAKENQVLQDGLAQKSEEIEKHEEEKLNELFKKNKEILDLQDGLDKKSVEIQKLNEEIANKIKESLRLEDGLKSEEIQKLQEEITSKAKENEDLQDGLVQKSKELEEKHSELDKKNKEIRDLQDGLAQKSEEMQILKEEKENKIKECCHFEEALAQKSEVIQNLEEKIQTVNMVLQNKNKDMEDLEKELLEKSEEITQRLNKMLEDEREARSLEKQETVKSYEKKLQLLKDKMMEIANEEVDKRGKLIEKSHKEKILKQDKEIKDLNQQLWELGEKLLKEKDVNRQLLLSSKSERGLKERCSSLRTIQDSPTTLHMMRTNSTGNLRQSVASSSQGEEVTYTQTQRSIRRTTLMPAPAPSRGRKFSLSSNSGRVFPQETEDEVGEVFDSTFLDMTGTSANDTFHAADEALRRISILQSRNSLCPPHLQSSYPGETQTMNPRLPKEDEIRKGLPVVSNDLELLLPKKKDKGQTTYQKPGPPTPTKRGPRYSLKVFQYFLLASVFLIVSFPLTIISSTIAFFKRLLFFSR
uniref:Flagellar attachment zone protein 1 n=1 Tax=Cacopsylla melanoneura TaxID=428564 RepID=A0A8D8R7R7_9HEMI